MSSAPRGCGSDPAGRRSPPDRSPALAAAPGEPRSHAEIDGLSGSREQLAREQHRAQGRMDQPRDLERGPIPSGNEHGHGDRSGPPREPGDRRAPRRIGDAQGARANEATSPAGKATRSPPPEGMRAPHASERALAAVDPGRAKGSTKTKNGRELRDPAEEEVGESLHVGPHRGERVQERDPLDRPERVVGDDEDGARLRNAPEIGLADPHLDPELVRVHARNVVARDSRRPAPVLPRQGVRPSACSRTPRKGAAFGRSRPKTRSPSRLKRPRPRRDTRRQRA